MSATSKPPNRLVTPYPLPDWAIPPADEFEVQVFDPDCTNCASTQVMLTSGPEPVGREIMDRLPALKYICCLGSGYEGVDVTYAATRGIIVSNSAIVTAEDVADQLLAITLALWCQVPALDRAIREGRWHKPIRTSSAERKVGIVGLGAIGMATARRLQPINCEIRWTGRRAKDSPYPYCENLDQLAIWSDTLLITARADSSNRHLIGRRVFDKLGPAGVIANVSRGSIIDEDELISALCSGRIGGAALDVFADEPTPAERWANVPNTVLSPHVGGYTAGIRRGIHAMAVANLRSFFAGGPLVGTIHEAI